MDVDIDIRIQSDFFQRFTLLTNDVFKIPNQTNSNGILYTNQIRLAILDSVQDKSSIVVVIVVPRNRENDWVFSTKEDHIQLLERCFNVSRLFLVGNITNDSNVSRLFLVCNITFQLLERYFNGPRLCAHGIEITMAGCPRMMRSVVTKDGLLVMHVILGDYLSYTVVLANMKEVFRSVWKICVNRDKEFVIMASMDSTYVTVKDGPMSKFVMEEM